MKAERFRPPAFTYEHKGFRPVVTAPFSVEPHTDPRQRFRSRRAQRFAARQVLWTESGIKRVRHCGRVLAVGNDLGVQVKASGSGDSRSAGFGGLQSCGSVWACPVCATKIAAERQQDLAAALRQWEKLGHGVGMVTLTMRHRKGQSLRALWDALSDAWDATTGGSWAWTDEHHRYGVPTPRVVMRGKNKGQTVVELKVHTVRVVEVTHGKHGWHVHVHALIFFSRPVSDETVDELGRRMFGRWAASLRASGYRAPLRDHGGLEAHAGTGDLGLFADYFTKAQYGSEGLAAEATRADLKGGRSGNRTPFQILQDVYEKGDAEDLAIWLEWERGSKGRRQIAWSQGLRELVALPVVEKTDEEIVDEDQGGAVLVTISPEDWHMLITARRGRMSELLDAFEADDTGLTGLMLLESWGVDIDHHGRLRLVV